MDKKSLLEWYIDAGVDEAIGDEPFNYFTTPSATITDALPHGTPNHAASAPAAAIAAPVMAAANTPASIMPLHHTPSAAAISARTLADNAHTLAELEAIVRAFDGCAIKKTATQTVFSDGNPKARVMIIGDAPEAQEDIQGIPFCGASGQLLDRMLAAIGLDRTSVYISNTVFWRPPGNRQPSPEESAICLPFVEKHIALINPTLLILSGGTTTTTLLKRDSSISRLRGKFYEYSNAYISKPITTMLMYHPSYLLRQPTNKRLAWNDLQLAKEFINNN